VLNGLLERPDWEVAIKMPIGIIPAGTLLAICFPRWSPCCFLKLLAWLHAYWVFMFFKPGTSNGMAKSLLDHIGEPCDAASATFLVIRGNLSLICSIWTTFEWGSCNLMLYCILRHQQTPHYLGLQSNPSTVLRVI
jgi:hypothetical protein